MKPVTIYVTPFCGYCLAAKRLLRDKGVDLTEIDVFAEPERRAEMVQRAFGRSTVPQVFIGDDSVGGFDEVYELDRSGRLDPMLKGG
jgi:glutaredoxin 3